MRQNFLINGINCHPATFALECKELNEKYHKNNTYNEIKSHHYILSFDPKDASERLLTPEQAQTLGMDFAKKNFPGHQTIVCTHEDGDNHSGNIHVHIILNSLRKEDVPRQDYMERPCDSKAGYKHHVTRDYLRYLKSDLMQTCQQHHLHQVDLLKKSRNRRLSQPAYWARLRSGALQAEPHRANTTVIPAPTPARHPAPSPVVILSGAKRPVDVCSAPTGAARRREESYLQPKHPKTESAKTSPTRPSVLAQLEQYEQLLNTHPTHPTRISSLQQTAQSLAYLQEQGYTTMEQFDTALTEANSKTRTTRQKVKSASSEIDALNAQLHHTGRYLTHKKTYQQFLKSKNKACFRKENTIAITEYETARDWLTSHAKAGTLPTSKYTENNTDKLPSIKTIKEIRDKQISHRNALRQEYNTAKQKERELRAVKNDLEALLQTMSIRKKDEQLL